LDKNSIELDETNSSERKQPDNSDKATHARQSYILAVLTSAALALFSLFQDTSQLEKAHQELRILQDLDQSFEVNFLHRRAGELLEAGDFNRAALKGVLIDSNAVTYLESDQCLTTQFEFLEDGWLVTYRSGIGENGRLSGDRAPQVSDPNIRWKGVIAEPKSKPTTLAEYHNYWNSMLRVQFAAIATGIAHEPLIALKFNGQHRYRDSFGEVLLTPIIGAAEITAPSNKEVEFDLLQGFSGPMKRVLDRTGNEIGIHHEDEFARLYEREFGNFLELDEDTDRFIARYVCVSKIALPSDPDTNWISEEKLFETENVPDFLDGRNILLEYYWVFAPLEVNAIPYRPLREWLDQSLGEKANALVLTTFDKAMPSLYAEFANLQSLSLDEIEQEISRRFDYTGGDIEVMGLKFPSGTLRIFGVALIAMVQLYFFLHFSNFVRAVESGDKAYDVPWIALYPALAPKVIFFIIIVVLPIGASIALLSTHVGWHSIFSLEGVLLTIWNLIGAIVVGVIALLNAFTYFDLLKKIAHRSF